MGASNWVFLEGCRVVRLTNRAALIEHNDEEIWIPLSVIDDPERLEVGDTDLTIGVKEWFADKEGIGQ